MKHIDTTPTQRTLPNGKIAMFYSPQQIEEIVPVTVRQPSQKAPTSYSETHLNNVSARRGKVGLHHI